MAKIYKVAIFSITCTITSLACLLASIPAYAESGAMLLGGRKNSIQRWQLSTGSVKDLIGMGEGQITTLFGKTAIESASEVRDEHTLVWILEDAPKKKSACDRIDLKVDVSRGSVVRVSIVRLTEWH